MASSSSTLPEMSAARTDMVNSKMQVTDQSSMVMISAPLNGNNWLSWSQSVRITLEGRDKLGFIDGTCLMPTEGTVELRQW
ncbi:UNVERIFIED_CONTAM: hypothetical protein Sradi_2252200 [Sesamum radiatum]|uniref:Retrotransposon Copia-like N-terminal domain-containing protein n=1 Tax=Sesamum radiatum TaxID=300843 RepID=A0AAW2T349_SESRA